MTLGELADQYLGADKNDVAAIARKNFRWIAKTVGDAVGNEEAGICAAITIFSSFVTADGKLTEEEWAEFQYIFQLDMGDDEQRALLAQCEEKSIFDFTKKTMRSFDDEMRKNIIVFGLAVCCIDDLFSDPEADYIHDLIKIRESMM